MTGLEGSHKAVSLKNEALFIFKADRNWLLTVESAHGPIIRAKSIKIDQEGCNMASVLAKALRSPSASSRQRRAHELWWALEKA